MDESLRESIVLFSRGHFEVKGTPEKPVGTIRRKPDGKLHFQVQLPPEACEGKVDAVTISDEVAGRVWAIVVRYLFAKIRLGFKEHAGAYDWRAYRTEAEGRALGLDGKPLGVRRTEVVDAKTGSRRINCKLDGELVPTTADYDESDWLAHHRMRVGDWADACRVLVELTQQKPAGRKKQARKRAKRTIPTAREEQALELRSRRYSLSQIGKELGISRQRAGQLLESAAARTGPQGRSIDLAKATGLRADYSSDKQLAQKTKRQRQRCSNSENDG